MTLYAGETVQVKHRALGYDKSALTPDVGVTATITIWDLDKVTVLVDEFPMDWDPALKFEDGRVGGWRYYWDTPPVPGAYEVRCTVAGFDVEAWEFKTIRVRRNPR